MLKHCDLSAIPKKGHATPSPLKTGNNRFLVPAAFLARKTAVPDFRELFGTNGTRYKTLLIGA